MVENMVASAHIPLGLSRAAEECLRPEAEYPRMCQQSRIAMMSSPPINYPTEQAIGKEIWQSTIIRHSRISMHAFTCTRTQKQVQASGLFADVF